MLVEFVMSITYYRRLLRDKPYNIKMQVKFVMSVNYRRLLRDKPHNIKMHVKFVMSINEHVTMSSDQR